MTKKHFEAFARAISDGQFLNCTTAGEVTINKATRRKIGEQFADICATLNPCFDRSRFLRACGLESGK